MTDVTTSSVSLNWTESTGQQCSFKVQWTNGTNNWNQATNKTSFTITSLTSGVGYNVTVSAVAADGSIEAKGQTVSLYTSRFLGLFCRRHTRVLKHFLLFNSCFLFCFVFFPAGPGKVAGISVDTNTSSISLYWTSPLGLTLRYRVEWTSGTGPLWTVDTSAVLLGLIPGSSYTITITVMVGNNVTGEPYTLTAVTSNLLFRQLSHNNSGPCPDFPSPPAVSYICRTGCSQEPGHHQCHNHVRVCELGKTGGKRRHVHNSLGWGRK